VTTTGLRLVVAALACVVHVIAAGADLTLLSGFVSWHSEGRYCERNGGVGARLDSGAWAGWAAGAYRNSLCRTSVYVGREWVRPVAGPLHVGVVVALSSGYRFAVVPAVLPEIVVRFDRFEVALIVQPFEIRHSPAFVAAQWRYRI
jgi:hypothetical protein